MKPAPDIIEIDGVEHRMCLAPEHMQMTPLSEFAVRRSGKLAGRALSRCKSCLNRAKKEPPANSGLVPVAKVWPVFHELEARLGRMETTRRTGISPNFWYRVEKGLQQRMQKESVVRAIAVLHECREREEVRHRDSIQYGAALRGRPEKRPTANKDFYNQSDDGAREDDARYKRNRRRQALAA